MLGQERRANDLRNNEYEMSKFNRTLKNFLLRVIFACGYNPACQSLYFSYE